MCSLKEGVGPEVSKQLLSNVLENLQKWPEVDRKVPFLNSTGVDASVQSRKIKIQIQEQFCAIREN